MRFSSQLLVTNAQEIGFQDAAGVKSIEFYARISRAELPIAGADSQVAMILRMDSPSTRLRFHNHH